MSTYIYITQLRELLAVDDSSIAYWQRAGLLVPQGDEGSKRYAIADVNTFLASRQLRGFAQAPTVADLLSGKVELVGPVKAAEILNLAIDGLNGVLCRGRIRAIRLMKEYRYDVASLQAYMAARNNDAFLLRATVEHVIGLSRHTIEDLRQQGKLIDASDTYRRRFTRASLLTLLGELLPDWIDPRDWLEDRLESKRPLITPRSMAWTRQDRGRIESLLEARQVLYINPPASHKSRGRLVSPDSWVAYIERTEPSLNDEDWARVFGVSRQSISYWRTKQPHCLDCTVHDHPDGTVHRTCLPAILKQYVSPRLSPLVWCRGVFDHSVDIISSREAARILGVQPSDVLTMLHEGRLNGLRTPLGSWVFSRVAVRDMRDKQTRARKAAQ